MQIPVPSGSWAARAAAVVVLAAVALVAFAGCRRMPSTSLELYEKIAKLNGEGATGEIWDLMAQDSRDEFIAAIDGHRNVLRRNPDPNEKLTRQYNCTRAEFMVLSYRELFIRENRGRERVFVDAKVTDQSVDPRRPDEEVLTIVPPAGPKVYMRARHVSGGWEFVQFMVEAQ